MAKRNITVFNNVRNVLVGVTSFCPTLVTSPRDVYSSIIPYVKKAKGGKHGANNLGLHLEGPFISPLKKGAHPVNCIRDLSGGFNDIQEMYGDLEDVAIITLAPELDEDCTVVEELFKRGIAVSLGHSVSKTSKNLVKRS